MTGAAGVAGSTSRSHRGGRGSSPTAALQSLRIQPISLAIAKGILIRYHYLHSLPGGASLALGVFDGNALKGTIAFGAGPFNAYRIVSWASPRNCSTLTRMWLSDDLPPCAESRSLGIVLRFLRRHTSLKFLVTYADPEQGHCGTIYQATNWLYTGLSDRMPLYTIGDGRPRHSRSLSHAFGTHSIGHFRQHRIPISVIPQSAKHRYVYFLDPSWRSRLHVPVLPYPKREASHAER